MPEWQFSRGSPTSPWRQPSSSAALASVEIWCPSPSFQGGRYVSFEVLRLTSFFQARNCFSDILIALNLSDSVHIVLAMLENLRNCLEENYPAVLIHIFPHFHYPFYRSDNGLIVMAKKYGQVVSVKCQNAKISKCQLTIHN